MIVKRLRLVRRKKRRDCPETEDEEELVTVEQSGNSVKQPTPTPATYQAAE